MNQFKIYNAGPLFSEAEVKQRRYEGAKLRETGALVFNPIDAPFNDTNPSASDVFIGDYQEIVTSNVFFFDLTTNDPGTLVELGMALEIRKNKEILIYPIFSDIRLSRPGEGLHSPIGYNQFVTGSLLYHHIPVFHSFDDAYEAFIIEINKDK